MASTRIDLAANYVKKTYAHLPGLQWETELRSVQLVSELIPEQDKAHQLLLQLIKNEPEENKKAYNCVQSRSAPGWRIIVNLNEIKNTSPALETKSSSSSTPSPSEMQLIVDFLNQVHAPVVTKEGVSRSWPCIWSIIHGKIGCPTPGIYANPYVDVLSEDVFTSLTTQFNEKATQAGFDSKLINLFTRNLSLTVPHKKGGEYYGLSDPILLNALLKLAKRYNEIISYQKTPDYRENTAAAVLRKLPHTVGKLTGSFLNTREAAATARVDKKSANAAKQGHLSDEKKKRP